MKTQFFSAALVAAMSMFAPTQAVYLDSVNQIDASPEQQVIAAAVNSIMNQTGALSESLTHAIEDQVKKMPKNKLFTEGITLEFKDFELGGGILEPNYKPTLVTQVEDKPKDPTIELKVGPDCGCDGKNAVEGKTIDVVTDGKAVKTEAPKKDAAKKEDKPAEKKEEKKPAAPEKKPDAPKAGADLEAALAAHDKQATEAKAKAAKEAADKKEPAKPEAAKK